VLCVDDDKAQLALLKARLEKLGCAVIPSLNGKQALVAAKMYPPSLVILDLEMPEMDGFTFLKHIDEHSLLEGTPVLVYTANLTKENLLRFVEGGHAIAGAIQKAASTDELLTKVCAILGINDRASEADCSQSGFDARMAAAGTRHKSIDVIARRVGMPSTLPDIAIKIMQMTADLNTDLGDLTKVIEADASLAASLLRTVNSAATGLRRRINTLPEAVGFLGFSRVRDMATSASVSKMFQSGKKIGPYDRSVLWRHLVTVGLCTRMLAHQCKMVDAESGYLAGLLHDMGVILEDQYDNGNFSKMILALQDGDSLVAAEKACLGYDHTVLGGRMATEWKFPDVIRGAMRFHHASHAYQGEGAGIVRCVEVANYICTARGITSTGLKLATSRFDVFNLLDTSKEALRELLGDLDAEVDRHKSILELVS
jgi:putative nucleotidyltransferase with HDIG domain